MTKANLVRFMLLVIFAGLTACKTTQPPAPVRAPEPVRVVVPAPTPAPPPAPVYVEPDYTLLDGHSSRTTPMPVEPVDVQEMGPVISE